MYTPEDFAREEKFMAWLVAIALATLVIGFIIIRRVYG